jgi:hypothetical protein
MSATHKLGIDWCDVCHQAASNGHTRCPGTMQVRLIKGKQISFREWYERVDACVQYISGVSVMDLGDFDSWGSWDSQITPASAARQLLEDEGFPNE